MMPDKDKKKKDEPFESPVKSTADQMSALIDRVEGGDTWLLQKNFAKDEMAKRQKIKGKYNTVGILPDKVPVAKDDPLFKIAQDKDMMAGLMSLLSGGTDDGSGKVIEDFLGAVGSGKIGALDPTGQAVTAGTIPGQPAQQDNLGPGITHEQQGSGENLKMMMQMKHGTQSLLDSVEKMHKDDTLNVSSADEHTQRAVSDLDWITEQQNDQFLGANWWKLLMMLGGTAMTMAGLQNQNPGMAYGGASLSKFGTGMLQNWMRPFQDAKKEAIDFHLQSDRENRIDQHNKNIEFQGMLKARASQGFPMEYDQIYDEAIGYGLDEGSAKSLAEFYTRPEDPDRARERVDLEQNTKAIDDWFDERIKTLSPGIKSKTKAPLHPRGGYEELSGGWETAENVVKQLEADIDQLMSSRDVKSNPAIVPMQHLGRNKVLERLGQALLRNESRFWKPELLEAE